MDLISQIWEIGSPESARDYLTSLAKEPIRLRNFINNKFQDQSKASSWIDSFDPRSGKPLAQIPRSTTSDVDLAVDAAAKAFPSWSQVPRQERSNILLRIASVIFSKKEVFATWESIDQGKSLARARVEVERAISNFRLVLDPKLQCSRPKN
jgi:acyl-CoA reductase-like NAD-dependent aldehyde dehydrogenase